MPIKKYVADADNTIVNAFQPNLQTRGTGSNAGQADIVEVYSIYGRQASGSQELSRILVKFPVDSISTDRTSGIVPASGSVSFYLKLHNAETSRTVPKDFSLTVEALSQSWQEGDGLDLISYKDLTRGNIGSNWIYASKTQTWNKVGGDYLTSSAQWDLASEPPQYSQDFSTGLEDLEIDITSLVENWMAGDLGNYGVGVKLSSSFEAYYSSSTGINTGSIIHNTGGATVSYYTKRMFARGTQYYFKKPVIEARWNDIKRDDRANFYYSSSLAPAEDNLNTLYIYNYVRGRLTNIPAVGITGSIMVSLYSGSSDNSEPSGSRLILHNGATSLTGGYVSTGIYSCSVALTASSTPIKTLYDVWHSGSHSDEHAVTTEFVTGSIKPKLLTGNLSVEKPVYFINITNLQNEYRKDENARFNVFMRNKFWSPSIYTKAKQDPEHSPVVSASYRVFRTLDALEAVPYNTGSDFATGLSYDVSGSYFEFDMKNLEPGYEYGFKFAFYDDENKTWKEQNKVFKFRVLDYEY